MLKWNFRQVYNSHNKRIIIPFVLLVFILMVFPWANPVYAYDNTMETPLYDVEILVNENNTLDIKEIVTVDFLTPHHGIFRNINYRGETESIFNKKVFTSKYRNKIVNLEVPGYPFENYSEGDYWVIKIGSGAYTLQGVNNYVIKYKVIIRDEKNTDFDSFYYNVIPYGWATPISEARLKITFPKALSSESTDLIVGYYGEIKTVPLNWSEDGRTITAFLHNLDYGQGATLISIMEEGYFDGLTNYDWAQKATVFAALLAVILAYLTWRKFGKDPQVIETVEFYPPPGISSAEAGYIIDGVTDKKDLVSLVIYLAEKGYLSIEPGKKEKDTLLYKKKDLPSNEKIYLRTFFEGLFSDSEGDIRDRVTISELQDTFYPYYTASMSQLNAYFESGPNKENRIFHKSSKLARLVGFVLVVLIQFFTVYFASLYGFLDDMAFALIPCVIITLLAMALLINANDQKSSKSKRSLALKNSVGLFLLLVAVFILATIGSSMSIPWWLITLVSFSLVTVIVFTLLMRKRTEKGAELFGKILGFKNFIKNAELPKLKELVDEDPQYFYSILPYAYVLGLSNKWIKKFNNIVMESPDFIEGSYDGINTLNAVYLGNILSGTAGAVQNFRIPKEALSDGKRSGSFGGSGGGFSGGGGFGGGGMGGGGGGGW